MKNLNIKNTELNMSIGHMKYKINNLEKDIKTLKERSNDLLNTVVKFTKGKQNLDMLLSNERASLNKQGVGFSHFQNTQYENGFIRETTQEKYIFVIKKHTPSNGFKGIIMGEYFIKLVPLKYGCLRLYFHQM